MWLPLLDFISHLDSPFLAELTRCQRAPRGEGGGGGGGGWRVVVVEEEVVVRVGGKARGKRDSPVTQRGPRVGAV